MSNDTATLSPLQQKFADIKDVVVDRTLERELPTHLGIASILSRNHFLMLGPPGVAKSMIARLLSYGIGLDQDEYFEALVGAFSTPEDLFGPIDLKALTEENQHRRQYEGFLPTAKIAFLDELLKARPAILNTLLAVVNERIFHNGRERVQCPLGTVLAGANEYPVDPELAAFADRMVVRIIVDPIGDPANFQAMLQMEERENPEPIASWNDVLEAQTQVKHVTVASGVIEEVTMMRMDMARENILPSDRRFQQAMTVVKANAWMNGFDSVDKDDLRVLAHCLWTNPEDLSKTQKIVYTACSPIDAEATEVIDELAKVEVELNEFITKAKDPSMDSASRRSGGIHLFGAIKTAEKEIESLVKRDEGSRTPSATLIAAKERVQRNFDKLNSELFQADKAEEGE